MNNDTQHTPENTPAKTFYRVANTETNQGLWYDITGHFTGLIHNKFSFCKNKDLPMPFDEKIQGWLSATQNLSELWFWFLPEDVEQLEKHGYTIVSYEATNYRYHNNHWVICQKSSILKERLSVESALCLK